MQGKKQTLTNFRKLKNHLPYHYAGPIADKLVDITPLQVKLIFRGEITNIDKVDKVLRAARIIARKKQGLNKKSMYRPTRTQAVKSKLSV